MRIVRTLLAGIATSALTVLGGTLLVFLMAFYGTGDQQKTKLNINVESGPVVEYVEWWSHFIRGDFGGKFQSTPRLRQEILTGLQFTSTLVSIAAIMAFAGALGVSLLALSNKRGHVSRALEGTLFLSGNIPVFVIAFVLYDLLRGSDFMTPVPGGPMADHLPQLMVAGAVLCFGSGVLAELARLFRFELGKIMGEQYILSARARSAPVWLHVGKAALVPLSSALLARIPYLIGAAVIVELIFNIYGIGAVMLAAGQTGSFAQLMSSAVLLALIVVVTRVMNQLIVVVVDPRVRRG
jgi:peptide/nickel transport system permease protein